MGLTKDSLAAIADEVFDTLVVPREVTPFTERYPGFDLSDAYRIVAEIRRRREARGERVIGRKIGFTNSAAWAGYGISAPIWNYLYDTTTYTLASGFSLPIGSRLNVRMETEVALGLGKSPAVGMAEDDLLDCIEWVSLDFEVCTSIFPRWQFKVADAAATGVHVALLLGPKHPIGASRRNWADWLQSFSVTLSEGGGARFGGGGAQVLGSPLRAFGQLLHELERYGGEPLRAGDIVTTGTLTAAPPAAAGDVWRASVSGIPFAEIQLRLK
jgi:2-keto-4-pentenoate hydratase